MGNTNERNKRDRNRGELRQEKPTPKKELPSLRSKKPALVQISDLHFGSALGLLPLAWRTVDENLVMANELQQQLYAAWGMFNIWLGDLSMTHDITIVVNGDIIEGNHHGGKQMSLPEISDQVNVAVDTLAALLDGIVQSVYIVEGTECHTSNHENVIGKMLLQKGIPVVEAAGRKYVHKFARFEWAGKWCNFAHHAPTSSREHLRSNPLGIILANEQLASYRAGRRVPDICGWAHRHIGDFVIQDNQFISFSTGAWQGSTRYANKVVPSAHLHPSAVCLIDEGELVPTAKFWSRRIA